MDTAHTEQYKGLTIRLEHDQDCGSPLEGDCEPTISYAARSRYILGNQPTSPEEHAGIGRRIASGELVGLPVYAQVHGGAALSTGPFHCPWDSGLSGWIYIPKKRVLSDWYGGKTLTAKKRALAEQSLRVILESFSQWINGENYGYIIEGPAGEELNSCWGFVGQEYALQSARESADWHAAEQERQITARHVARCREDDERHYWQSRDVVTV